MFNWLGANLEDWIYSTISGLGVQWSIGSSSSQYGIFGVKNDALMSFRTTNGSEKSLIEHIEQNFSRDKSIFHFEYLPKTACWGVNSEGFLPSVEMTWLEHSSFDLFGVHKIALFYQNENCCRQHSPLI